MVRALIILSLFSYRAVAQTDYLITSRADTLSGDIRILSYDQLDRVQIQVGSKKELFTALQVLLVNKDGQEYRPLQFERKIVLMKVIKHGYLSLYAFRLPNQTSYDGRLLTKLDGTSIEAPNLAFKKILGAYLEDCETVSAQIKNGDFSRRDLEKIIDEYNGCLANKRSANPVIETTPVIVNNATQAIASLITKVEAQDFSSKKDALDLLRDIETKVGKNETIPNYLSEGLKSYLSSVPALSEDLEKLLALLKK